MGVAAPTHVRPLIYALCFFLGLMPSISGAAVSRKSKGAPERLRGVSRAIKFDFSWPANRERISARQIPGDRGIEIDLPVSKTAASRKFDKIPSPFHAILTPLSQGTRVKICHPTASVLFNDGFTGTSKKRKYHLVLGSASEDSQLRYLADQLRKPIPAPRDLGAHLELWQEAERAMLEKQISLARRLWEKLAEQESFRNLAELRIAELFVMTGHINEAVARLREVSRQYPRSPGASLARLTALHIEAITEVQKPNIEQILIAAGSSSRPEFRAFSWFRAADVFTQLNAPDLALKHFPRITLLPQSWQEHATSRLNRIYSMTITGPTCAGNFIKVVTHSRIRPEILAEHPQQSYLKRVIASAHVKLGLYDSTVSLLRSLLAKFPPKHEEARIIGELTESYHGLGESKHEYEVLRFLTENHPNSPELVHLIRRYILKQMRSHGLDAALKSLHALLDSSKNQDLNRSILGLEIELTEALGTPAQTLYALKSMKSIGYDDKNRRETSYAIALARDEQYALAEPRLRMRINKTTDPELRDEMAYLLANTEFRLNRPKDAFRILDDLAKHGTRWGLVARARLREYALGQVIEALEIQGPDLAAKGRYR